MIANFPDYFKTVRISPDECQFSRLFQNGPDFPSWLPIFRIISKLSGFFQMNANFTDDFKTVGFFQMTSNFPNDFKTVQTFQMTANFPDYSKTFLIFQMTANFPDDFKTVRIFPDDCQFSRWFQNCPDVPGDCQFSRWFQNCPDFSRWLPIFQMISKLSKLFLEWGQRWALELNSCLRPTLPGWLPTMLPSTQ